MKTNIHNWGDATAVVIPTSALKKSGLAIGDTVDLRVSEGKILIQSVSTHYTVEELIDQSPIGSGKAHNDEQHEWLNDTDSEWASEQY